MSPELQIQEICNWLLQQLPRFSSQGVVFEVAARIDSAVVAALAQRALGMNVLGLILPCHSTRQDTDEAIFLAEHLSVPYALVDLTSAHESLLSQLPAASSRTKHNLIQRLKMISLYHYAEMHNRLVVGFTNLGDWEIGRFVPHGNVAADLQPLMHLLRRDILELAFHLGLPPQILLQRCGTGRAGRPGA
jgi:NAD+ synthetase